MRKMPPLSVPQSSKLSAGVPRILVTPLVGLTMVAGCSPAPIISTPPAACSRMLPEAWRTPIEGTPIPDTGKMDLDAAKAWAQAYVSESGKLEIANGRVVDAIGIFERCEALQNGARGD